MSNAKEFNERSLQTTSQAAAVLAEVTGESFGNRADLWWDWWDQGVTDSPAVGEKPRYTEVEIQTVVGVPRQPLRFSCLVAGTPVWTEEGFRPIETIQIGDRVLSKNTETGELRYQPVLQTTRRSGSKVHHIQVGDETISASLGHNFWISGRGWTRTNQLENGMSAHTPTGTVRLEVEPLDETADVFNLVVADFHTYFVGKAMLLGHDVLVPSPSDIRVPGLQPEFAELK